MLDVENLKDNDFPAETFNIIDVEDLNDGFEEDKNDLDSVSEAFSVGSSVGPTLNPPLIVKEEDEKSQICEIAVNLRIDSAIRKSNEYSYWFWLLKIPPSTPAFACPVVVNDDILLDGKEAMEHIGRPNPRQVHDLSLRSAYEGYGAGGEPLYTSSKPVSHKNLLVMRAHPSGAFLRSDVQAKIIQFSIKCFWSLIWKLIYKHGRQRINTHRIVLQLISEIFCFKMFTLII